MSDLISRQAAITAIQNAYCDTEGGEDKCAVWKNVGLTNALHIMQDLPSAQPERNTGKWIFWYEEIKNDTCTEYIPHCKCSECGTEYDSHTVKFINFCQNCGAKMKKEKNHDT